MKKYLLIPVLLVLTLSVSAQKEFEYREMTWLAYFNQTRLTNRSGIWLDAHWRLNDDFLNETHALLGRLGYIYYFADRTRLTIGHAYQYQPGHNGAADVLEHRPWQQIQWIEKKKYFNLMQWIRTEQRYRKQNEEGYEYNNFRFRYNIALTVPLTSKEVKDKTLFFFTNNEVFINAGKNVVNNYFDQNRFFVGLGYQLDSHSNLQFGYMNIFQQLPAGNAYVKTDAIRLFFFHNIDLRASDDH